MGPDFLIDTSAASKFLKGQFPSPGIRRMKQLVDEGSVISFVTQIELLSWPLEDATTLSRINEFLEGSKIIGLSEEIIQLTAEIRRDFGLKLPDALIAATAQVLRTTLVADNDRDFLRVPGLDYFNPTRPF